MPKTRRLLGWSAVLISQIWAATTLAQATPSGTAETTVPATTAKLGEEITVTGSRIRRKDLTTPAPVTVIGREQISASGKATLGDFLQSLPEQSNPLVNNQTNNGGDGSSRVSLRGLGDLRTLVLVNGRRFVGTGYLPTFSEVSVDLNSIPTAAIERIEILKDGASSIYGSDAIGGVINLITRKRFDGVELSVGGGTTAQPDAQMLDVSATYGVTSDRGSLMFSLGYQKQKEAFAGDRDWSRYQLALDPTSPLEGPLSFTSNPAISGSSSNPAGRFILPSSACTAPATPQTAALCAAGLGGKTLTFGPNDPLGFHVLTNADRYNFQPLNYIMTPFQRIQVFSTGEVNVTSNIRAYYEASLVNRQSDQQLAEEPLTSASGSEPLVVSKNSIYNPLGVDITSFGRRLTEFGPRHFSQELDTFRVVAGLNGTLPDTAGPLSNWFWDANVNYGRSWGNYVTKGYLRTDRMGAALGPSMIDPASGKPICVTTPGDPTTAIPGCSPINLFHQSVAGLPTNIDPASVNYLGYTGISRALVQMFDIQGTLTGELPFKLMSDRAPGIAVGYEYRNEFGSNTPDPIAGAGQASEGNFVGTAGGYHSNEAFAELSLPIMSNAPFVYNLEATASARYVNYSSFGDQLTYKFGARYSPIPDFTVRGTYSTAFRAPTVSELFLGSADNFPPSADPCNGLDANGDPKPITPSSPYYAGCVASGANALNNGDPTQQLKTRNGGNPKLKAETANVLTAGIVIEPRQVKGLTLTVDYWNFAIDNAISTRGADIILTSCLVSDKGSASSPFCQAIHRNASDGIINSIDDLNVNASTDKADGVDIAARYAIPTPYGRFGLLFDATWLHKYDRAYGNLVIHGKESYDIGIINNGSGGVYPAWKFNAGVNYANAGFTGGLNMRYIGSFHECVGDDGSGKSCSLANLTGSTVFTREIPAYTVWNLVLGYQMKSFGNGRTSILAGVNNLFNKTPPSMFSVLTPGLSDPTAYDFLGRYFYVRLTQAL